MLRTDEARAVMLVAASIAKQRSGQRKYADLLWQSCHSYKQLMARAAIGKEAAVEMVASEFAAGEPFDDWPGVFEKRLTVLANMIAYVAFVAGPALDGDLHEGKGSVRERLRKADALIEGAKDAAQKLRYARQVEELRRKFLMTDLPVMDGHPYPNLATLVADLQRELWRVHQAWQALSPAQQARIEREHPAWVATPEHELAWFYGLDIDHQLFADLGV